MIGAILDALNPISRIADAIAKAKIAVATAQTDQERIAAEERLKSLEGRQAVLIAESGNRVAGIVNSCIRALLALPVAFLLWKVLVYDKALGQWTQGRTDALDENLWKVVAAVIAFYFLYDIAARFKR